MKRALKIGEQKPWIESSRCYINISQVLALTYSILGDYQKQLEVNLKSLSMQETILLADDPNLAFIYNELGVNYSNLYEFDKSLEFNKKSLAIREKVYLRIIRFTVDPIMIWGLPFLEYWESLTRCW